MSNALNNSQSGITSTNALEVSAHIDWISVTVSHHTMREATHGVVLYDDFKLPFVAARGTMGYVAARRYASGAIVQWHPAHPKMGVHVSYPAQALEYAANNFGVSQHDILAQLTAFGRVSRLDMCVDVKNVEIDIQQIHKDAKSGKIKTRAKQFDYVESAKAGNERGAATTYIGSMHKRKKLLRIYDKGAQLNLDHFKTRFELEVHGLPAQNAAKVLMKAPESMAENIHGMITGYADFTGTKAGKYLSSDIAIKLAHPQYQKSKTANWLIDTVAKSLAKEVYKVKY